MRRAATVSLGREVRSVASRRPQSAAGGTVASSTSRGDFRNGANQEMDPPPMEATMACVSVVEEGSQIAFACYNEESNDILIEHSYASGYDTEEIVERFFAVSRPNLILVGNKVAGTSLLEVLTRPLPQDSTDTASQPSRTATTVQASGQIPYRLLKSGSLDVKRCKTLILNKIRVLSLLRRTTAQPGTASALYQGTHQRDRTFANERATWNGNTRVFGVSSYHSLASIIDFESSVQVRALGSLLFFLQETLFKLEEAGTVTVNAVKKANTSMFMSFGPGALSALHIFSTEHHPLLAKGQGHCKEGFSLFSHLDRTKSKMGRHTLKEWMLKPLLDREEIAMRQNGVELFLRPEFQAPVGALLGLLENVGAVNKILIRMQKFQTAPMDFLVLARTLNAAISICRTLTNDFLGNLSTPRNANDSVEENENGLNASEMYRRFVDRIVTRCHVSVLRDLQERIASIIDEPMTIELKDTVVIQTGFHEDLDAAKNAFDTLDETLDSAANQIFARHPQLKNLAALFLPQIGFLVKIDKRDHEYDEDANAFPGLPPEFTCVFVQDNDAYLKNPDMHQLDEELGDLDAFIKDTEGLIVSSLEDDILDGETELRETFGALAELDVILSFAHCAADHNYIRPQVVDTRESVIQIKGGRHPLMELISEREYVSNDADVNPADRVNVLTGPNFSGKSCYIRQVGILVYMAHIGCFLPCERATISITDQILARINTVETCAVPQSSFQLDLTQMGTILRRATPSSLVLVDEFGKGTNPASGIAVLTAALTHLLTKRCKAICTTHFLEMFSLGLLRERAGGVKALRMAVNMPESFEDEEPTPLFKLEDGVASSSAGLVCAKTAGVKKTVVNRAKEVIQALREGRSLMQEPREATHLSPDNIEALKIFLSQESWESQDANGSVLALQRALGD